jgi:microcystin-dependent protein
VGYNTDTLSGRSTRALNATGGVEGVTLTAATSGLPEHSHTLRGGGFNGTSGAEPGSSVASNLGEVGTTGGTDAAAAHENMQPYITVNFIIRGL